MSNIRPFDRANEFPNYFEIMLKSVPEKDLDAFIKKIQKLIEQNINAVVTRLKLYYVNEKGELSTDDYFNELVKSMEHVLKDSSAKDDYNLEVYLSGGVVRTLLGYVYRQLHINIQEVFEEEFEAAKRFTDKDEIFKAIILDELKNSTEADTAKKHVLETVLKRLEDQLKPSISFKDKEEVFKTILDELKNFAESDTAKQHVLETVLKRLEGELRPPITSRDKEEVFKAILDELKPSIRSKDKDAVFKTILDELETSTTTDQAKQKSFEAVLKREAFLKNFTTTTDFWLQKLKTKKSKLQNSYVLGVGSDMDILYKLNPQTARHKSKLNDAQLKKLHEVLLHEKALTNMQKTALHTAVKEQILNEAQLKDLKKAINNQYQLYDKKLQRLQEEIKTERLDQKKFGKEPSSELSNIIRTAREQYITSTRITRLRKSNR